MIYFVFDNFSMFYAGLDIREPWYVNWSISDVGGTIIWICICTTHWNYLHKFFIVYYQRYVRLCPVSFKRVPRINLVISLPFSAHAESFMQNHCEFLVGPELVRFSHIIANWKEFKKMRFFCTAHVLNTVYMIFQSWYYGHRKYSVLNARFTALHGKFFWK